MKRYVIIETLTRWKVEIPENVEDEKKVLHAWRSVMTLTGALNSKNRMVNVTLTVPRDVKYSLREMEVEEETGKEVTGDEKKEQAGGDKQHPARKAKNGGKKAGKDASRAG